MPHDLTLLDQVGSPFEDLYGLVVDGGGKLPTPWMDGTYDEYVTRLGENPHGASTVAYWPVTSLDAARARLTDVGCTPLRGPLDIDPQRSICQLVDPFGITFGLEGPR